MNQTSLPLQVAIENTWFFYGFMIWIDMTLSSCLSAVHWVSKLKSKCLLMKSCPTYQILFANDIQLAQCKNFICGSVTRQNLPLSHCCLFWFWARPRHCIIKASGNKEAWIEKYQDQNKCSQLIKREKFLKGLKWIMPEQLDTNLQQ